MPIACVITCKKCDYKTHIPVIQFTGVFGITRDWQDAKPSKCKGCGYDHGIRISVKEITTKVTSTKRVIRQKKVHA